MTEKENKLENAIQYIKTVVIKIRKQDRKTIHKKVSSLFSIILEHAYLIDAITEEQKDEYLTKYEVSKHKLIEVIYDTPEEEIEEEIRKYMRTVIIKAGFYMLRHGLIKFEDMLKMPKKE